MRQLRWSEYILCLFFLCLHRCVCRADPPQYGRKDNQHGTGVAQSQFFSFLMPWNHVTTWSCNGNDAVARIGPPAAQAKFGVEQVLALFGVTCLLELGKYMDSFALDQHHHSMGMGLPHDCSSRSCCWRGSFNLQIHAS